MLLVNLCSLGQILSLLESFTSALQVNNIAALLKPPTYPYLAPP